MSSTHVPSSFSSLPKLSLSNSTMLEKEISQRRRACGSRILYSNYRQLGFFNQFGEFSSTYKYYHSGSIINTRPAGVQLVTRPARGGGGQRATLRSPKLLDRFSNSKHHWIALYVNYPIKVQNLSWRSLMTSQVMSKSKWSTFRDR